MLASYASFSSLSDSMSHITCFYNASSEVCLRLEQGFPSWVHVPSLEELLRLAKEEKYIYILFPTIYTYISEYYFQKSRAYR